MVELHGSGERGRGKIASAKGIPIARGHFGSFRNETDHTLQAGDKYPTFCISKIMPIFAAADDGKTNPVGWDRESFIKV